MSVNNKKKSFPKNLQISQFQQAEQKNLDRLYIRIVGCSTTTRDRQGQIYWWMQGLCHRRGDGGV
jgi:hypothetical protein